MASQLVGASGGGCAQWCIASWISRRGGWQGAWCGVVQIDAWVVGTGSEVAGWVAVGVVCGVSEDGLMGKAPSAPRAANAVPPKPQFRGCAALY